MQKSLIGTLIFGPLFAVVGYFVAFHFGKPILDNAKASTNWPSVEGVIERSEVVTSKGNNKKTLYSADVDYRFTVDGQELRSSTVSFGGETSSSSSSQAYAVTNLYPVGRKVQVFYEPAEPANAVLEPGVTWKSYMVFGIGLAFLVVGVLMFAGPVCYLAFGALIIAGAASGAIERRKSSSKVDQPVWPDAAALTKRSASQPKPDDADDGFDIG